MDLNRHIQVLWRGKLILVAGFVLGVAIALFANFKLPSLEPRKPPVYTTATKLMLTQDGFPWGRTSLPGTDGSALAANGEDATAGNDSAPVFADPGRLANLAWMYSHFLMGDEVRALTPNVPEETIIDATPVTAGGNMSASALPLIALTISAPSPGDAQRLSEQVPQALERYLAKQQEASNTPAGSRVEVEIVNRSQAPLANPSKAPMMTLVMIIMALAASVALIYVRENLRMQRQVASAAPEKERRAAEPVTPEAAPRSTGLGPGVPVSVRAIEPEEQAVAVGDGAGWASGPAATGVSRISRGNR